MCWHLLRTILQDPYARAQAIMSDWQLSFLTCGWRGCWKPRSAMTRSKAASIYLVFQFFCHFGPWEKKKQQIMGFTVRFNAYVSDDWTSFRCSRQGNLQIQSRYVLWILKKKKNNSDSVPWGIQWELCRTGDRQPCPPTEHGQHNRKLQYNAIQCSPIYSLRKLSYLYGMVTLVHGTIYTPYVALLCLNILKLSFILNVKPVFQFTVSCTIVYMSQMF